MARYWLRQDCIGIDLYILRCLDNGNDCDVLYVCLSGVSCLQRGNGSLSDQQPTIEDYHLILVLTRNHRLVTGNLSLVQSIILQM